MEDIFNTIGFGACWALAGVIETAIEIAIKQKIPLTSNLLVFILALP